MPLRRILDLVEKIPRIDAVLVGIQKMLPQIIEGDGAGFQMLPELADVVPQFSIFLPQHLHRLTVCLLASQQIEAHRREQCGNQQAADQEDEVGAHHDCSCGRLAGCFHPISKNEKGQQQSGSHQDEAEQLKIPAESLDDASP